MGIEEKNIICDSWELILLFDQLIGGNIIMADLSVNGRKKVSTLAREFKQEYGLTLDVKEGKGNRSAEST